MSIDLRIVDVAYGRPARDVAVRLERQFAEGWQLVYVGRTDDTGYIGDPFQAYVGLNRPHTGVYRLTLDCAGYFGLQGTVTFYRDAVLTFFVADTDEKHGLCVLMGPQTLTACHTRCEP
ncbi:hydroxyisourate hydrolase [Micromonospora echinofusca]|uniref:Transthyretin/hydroxyisourate hydrolase domain-containing protein n=1 Tax=Micromonospora echinofusca TaxID=47858 RepID=A0ABS3VIS4_MICEH|nr:hydroxyisourate hydrolase [Micromonospora echinofusca]MBO4204425.1 hypothetical protein [Micromonospora echinofusca]